MKKLLTVVLAVVLAALLTGAAFGADAKTPIRIGAMYAFSGDLAAIGTNIIRGIDFAVQEINAAGGINGRPVEVVRGDHQGDPKVGRSVAERLITQDKVDAIVGCHQSSITAMVQQVCEQYQIPVLTAISTVDSLSSGGYEYFFRLAPMNSIYQRNMFIFLKDQTKKTGAEIKKVAVFADNTMIGQETIKWANYWAPQYDLEVVKEIQYTKGAADMTSEVLALKNAGADAVVTDGYISDAILLMKTMHEQNCKPKILIAKANGFADPSFIPATQGISNGLTSVVEWNPDLTKGREVNKKFKEIFGLDMNGHSAESYTAIWTLKTAFEAAGSSEGPKVKDALEKLDIQGSFPNGPEIILPYDRIKFEDMELDGVKHHHNNVGAALAIAQIQEGEYKTVWPFDYSNQQFAYPAEYK
ncbi:MAG: ABC transporter substrate-binding protein [Synergistaceae bacterium]|nr:ABC transporter substrate-binding protein [Synergistaceae bacterium]